MFVRPSGKQFGDFGVFERIGENRASEVFTGSKSECYDFIERTERAKKTEGKEVSN